MRVLAKYRTVLMALVCCMFFCVGISCWLEKTPADYLYVTINGKEEIPVWGSQEKGYYFFLPAYADPASTVLTLGTQNRVSVDGRVLETQTLCTEFQTGVPYTLTYTVWGMEKNAPLTFCQSANLPAMYIDTESGTMDLIHSSRENKEAGAVRIYLPDGMLQYSGNAVSISGRGNSTWQEYEKKPYSIKLENAADLLGMGAAHKWVLLANAADASHLKNKTVFDVSSYTQMQYTPDSQWVDLYLNGDYAGLYLLCEKIEIHPNRLNLSGEPVFLVSQEVEDRMVESHDPYVKTNRNQTLRVRDASMDHTQLQDIWQNAEDAICSTSGIDPVTGKNWTELIDLDSWARKYLIEEFFGNPDGGYCSQYYYTKDTTGMIYAGPVWDYDYSMYYPTAFYVNRLRVKDEIETPWYPALWEKNLFRSRVIALYEEELKPIIRDVCRNEIDFGFGFISNSAEMDAIRWEMPRENFYEAVDHIKTYLSERVRFLDSVWLHSDHYIRIEIDTRAGNNIEIHTLKSGETMEPILSKIIAEGEDSLRWYDAQTNQPVDPSAPVTKDMSIYGVWDAAKTAGNLPILLPTFFFGVIFLVLLYRESKNLSGLMRKREGSGKEKCLITK